MIACVVAATWYTMVACFVAATSYTMLYNVLDLPAGSLPVSVVSPSDEAQAKSYPGTDPISAAIREVSLC